MLESKHLLASLFEASEQEGSPARNFSSFNLSAIAKIKHKQKMSQVSTVEGKNYENSRATKALHTYWTCTHFDLHSDSF